MSRIGGIQDIRAIENGHNMQGTIAADRLGYSIVYKIPPGVNRVSVQVDLDNTTSWPTDLVLSIQRGNNPDQTLDLATSVSFTSATIEDDIPVTTTYIRAVVTTVSTDDNSRVRVSFHSYPAYT